MRASAARVAVILAVSIGICSPAGADTVTVTGGNLDVSGSPASTFHIGTLDISGDRGFTLSSIVSSPEGNYRATECAFLVCDERGFVSLTAIWTGSAVTGTATLDGQTYTDLGGGSTPEQSSAAVQFSGTAALPSVLTPSAVVTAPFRFTGGFTPNISSPSVSLIGSGTATVFLERITVPGAGTGWGVGRVRYDFSSAPGDPIPEPTTLLLLGAGLGGVALRRARERKSAESA